MPALPHTASKSHRAFEPGDARLDPSSEPTQAVVDVFATAHIGFFKTALFGKASILDTARGSLGLFQIVFGCKPTVKADLERIAAIDLLLSVQHRDGQIRIGWIALDNQTIQDQVGSPAGQADLVAENRIPTILDNNVGVRFKDRYNLVGGGNFLIQHNPSMGLVDDLFGKSSIVVYLGLNSGPRGCDGTVFDCFSGLVGIAEHLSGNFEQIEIGCLALLFTFGIHDIEHPAFGPSVMVAKWRQFDVQFIPGAHHKPREHPHTVDQQGRIEWLVNVGLNTGAVSAHFAPLFDAFLFGISQDLAVDHLPALIADNFDIAVQGGFFKTFFGNADATKPAQALRVDDVKSQLLVSETEKDLDDNTAQHLFGTHALGAGTLGLGLALAEILQNIIADGRVCIDDAADHFQLFALGMIENVRHQGHLFLPFFAHFVIRSFSVFVVIFDVWRLLIYYKTKRIATAKCAFFIGYK